MKQERVYVRQMFGFHDGKWFDLYEVYTQPRVDYLRARLYSAWGQFLWKTRIEKVQDRLWYIWASYQDDPDLWEPPGVQHDCRSYFLDVKNQTVLGTVEIEKEDSMMNRD